ncbi:AAA family ATPase [Thermomonas sp. LB-4]|uniref:ATP-dependent nuclease n=1 Tax=Thermomonas sp. LB-4 TaxID=3102790 RepID=UPI002ED7EB59
MKSIKDLISTIEKFKPGAPLQKYIGSIRFPNFKNIEPGTTVDFPFPLTVLVGANGSGKSSILHALYGAPDKYSLKDFWFSTELDPIVEGKGLGVSRFIYAHWNSHIGEFVETRKARVRSGTRLDYWEPTKIVVGDGMKPLPAGAPVGAASDRWLPVERAVVHINFKAEISAFDRFFYFETGQSKEEKHIAMLREARRLKCVIEKGYSTYPLWNRERVFENRVLTPQELECVKHILGHQYISATIVRHTLYPGYRGQDISVLFERPSLKYSEAFAGSGEVAVVSSVVKLLAADAGTLVLLDEPETSLHPGAQRRFLQFLLDCIVQKKMQVVISTHSPEFVDELPDRAIKVLDLTPSGRVTVVNSSSSLVAFNRLGAKAPGRIRVIVEDELACKVVDIAKRALPAGERELIDAVVVPGGAPMILAHYIPSAIAGKDATFALLDGDQTFKAPLPDVASVAPADEGLLGDRIRASTGVDPSLYLTGGNDAGLQAKKIAAQKEYITWVTDRVRFLPRTVPEEIVVRAAFPTLVPSLDGTGDKAKILLYGQIANDVPDASASQVIEISGYELSKHASATNDVHEVSQILAGFVAKWRAEHG